MHRRWEVNLPINRIKSASFDAFARLLCRFVLCLGVFTSGLSACWFEAVDVLKPSDPLSPTNISEPNSSRVVPDLILPANSTVLDILVLPNSNEDCLETYFAESLWGSFLKQECSSCHQSTGIAHSSGLVFDLSESATADAYNFAMLKNMAEQEVDGESLLLLKPTGQTNHGGGAVLALQSEEANALETFVDYIANPNECGGTQNSESICGDGIVAADEFCDDGYTDACGTCNAECTGWGDGFVCGDTDICHEFEACDDGYTDACGSCNADCSAAGTGAICGDTDICPEFEACDDGYTDDCGSCNADCSAAGSGSVCGDTEVCPEVEACDDGYTDACGTCNGDCSAFGTGATCGDESVCPEVESCDEDEAEECGSCNASCSGPGNGQACGEEPCITTEEFFDASIWQPIFSATCVNCHVSGGVADASGFVLVAGETQSNLLATEQISVQEVDGESVLLLKARGDLAHGGGVQVAETSNEYQSLLELLGYFDNPPNCNEPITSVCGNGIIEGDEFCDDGYNDACGTCNVDCSATGSGSICGDIEICPEFESCDDGYADACGSCNADCSGQGTGSLCGDGVWCPEFEACDDGDLLECGACNALCSDLGTPAICEEEPCISDAQFFEDSVWNSFMFNSCYGCHNVGGLAAGSEFVLVDANQPGYLELNFQEAREIAVYEINDESLLWLKPSASVAHGGGAILGANSDEFAALQELVARFKEPSTCVDTTNDGNYWDGLSFYSPAEMLRKTTLNLAGRLPTAEESTLVGSTGENALDGILDTILEEDGFYDRLVEVYNDLLLTDRYLEGNAATGLLELEDYPDALYYRDLDAAVDGQDYTDAAKAHTNKSVAREALNLLAYIVRNDRPFYEILTADYMVMNPFSARSYGVTNLQFNDPLDPNEFQEVDLGLPHAGILTTTMFLRRFPTTDTNRNRHRAYMVYKMFLGTDVLEQEDTSIDIEAIEGFNPTMYNPVCTVCHNTLDPLAGSFQNWDHRARYRPRTNGWFVNMLHPGFEDELLPFSERFESLPWVAQRLANDPRFAHTTVRTLFTGFTGIELLRAPTSSMEEHYAAKLRAFEVQRDYLQHLKELLEGSNYNIKSVVKDIFLSPFMRVSGLQTPIGPERVIELESLSSARLLPPEMLHRKIEATMGTPWHYVHTETKWLLDDRWYLFPYGGIDSVGVTKRLTEPNGVMASVGLRMAMEMACKITTYDFIQPASERFLFPHVELTDEPMFYDSQGNNTGVNNPLTEAKAKQNIQHLFAQLLGEELAIDDEEIQIAYDLFYDTWVEGMTAIEAGSISINLWGACAPGLSPRDGTPILTEDRIVKDRNYLIRAWRAVISYLLADLRMLYEL